MQNVSPESNVKHPERVVFSLPTPLRRKMEALAEKNERSLAGEIRLALYQYVDRQEAEVA
jgi:predicted transcriptional regulator